MPIDRPVWSDLAEFDRGAGPIKKKSDRLHLWFLNPEPRRILSAAWIRSDSIGSSIGFNHLGGEYLGKDIISHYLALSFCPLY